MVTLQFGNITLRPSLLGSACSLERLGNFKPSESDLEPVSRSDNSLPCCGAASAAPATFCSLSGSDLTCSMSENSCCSASEPISSELINSSLLLLFLLLSAAFVTCHIIEFIIIIFSQSLFYFIRLITWVILWLSLSWLIYYLPIFLLSVLTLKFQLSSLLEVSES